jgi:hypothetical protein
MYFGYYRLILSLKLNELRCNLLAIVVCSGVRRRVNVRVIRSWSVVHRAGPDGPAIAPSESRAVGLPLGDHLRA